MKKTETYRRCEYCNELMREDSPPPKEQYESARIEIISGSMMLLPDRVAKAKAQAGISVSHATSLEGFYCGPRCFVNAIRVKLGAKPE